MVSHAQDILLSLAIGAEVFAVAALWPLSEWATAPHRRIWYAYALCAVGAVGGCIALEAHGLGFPVLGPGTAQADAAHIVQWLSLPLFIGFPDAVCVAVGLSLIRAGVGARAARATALGAGVLAVVVAPLAAAISGCGIAGSCY